MSTRRLPPERLSEDLPEGIGRPANAALVNIGVTKLEQVARMTRGELLALHGVGPKAVRVLAEELASRGMALREPAPGPADTT